MEIILKIFKRALFYVEILLIFLYLLLEELVWERFAKPLFRYVKYLRLFQKLENLLRESNRYVILFLFLLPFVVGELIGLLSPIVALKGYLFLGVLLYILKLLVVTFAFWLFKVEQDKLLSFKIIRYGYERIVEFTAWIKTTAAFKSITRFKEKLKHFTKLKIASLKRFINRYKS